MDEAWLPRIAAELNPWLIVLGNLFRDQLDRYGELEHLADQWAEVVGEPRRSHRVCALTQTTRWSPTWGATARAEAGGRALPTSASRTRRWRCPSFNTRSTPSTAAVAALHTRTTGAFVGHLGHYRVPELRRGIGPPPTWPRPRSRCDGMRGSRVSVRAGSDEVMLDLPLPGLYNVYNALAALTAAGRLGIGLADAARALGSMQAVFGRVETIDVGPTSVSILLIKNPAGANEVLRTLLLEADGADPSPGLDLWIALNDRIADGRDVSWVWDADFELLAGRVRRIVCAGTRAPEMAVRLKYAGIPDSALTIEESIDRSLDAALAAANGRLFALPTYTALLELRDLLARRGMASSYWE